MESDEIFRAIMFSLVTGAFAGMAVIFLLHGEAEPGIISLLLSLILAARWGYVYARDKYK